MSDPSYSERNTRWVPHTLTTTAHFQITDRHDQDADLTALVTSSQVTRGKEQTQRDDILTLFLRSALPFLNSQVMTASLIFTEIYRLFWHLILFPPDYPYLSFSLDRATHKINSSKSCTYTKPWSAVVKFYHNITTAHFLKKCTVTLQSKYKKKLHISTPWINKRPLSAFKGLLHYTTLKSVVIIKHAV